MVPGQKSDLHFHIMLIGLCCPRFASKKCVPEKCHVPNVTQLLSGSPGAEMLQPSETRRGFPTKCTLKGSGL